MAGGERKSAGWQELRSVLRHLDSAGLSSPLEDILEQVVVDRAQVRKVVVPVDRMFLQFETALQSERVFGFSELYLRLELEQVA